MNKNTLLAALELVKPGLATTEIIEQTTSLIFKDGKVVTYNDELCISHTLDGVDFIGAVNAKELYLLLPRLKKENIKIGIKDNELRIRCGRLTAGLKIEKNITLPFEEIEKTKKEWKSVPKEFINILAATAKVCAKNLSLPKFMFTCRTRFR
jgi:hypothetical protein